MSDEVRAPSLPQCHGLWDNKEVEMPDFFKKMQKKVEKKKQTGNAERAGDQGGGGGGDGAGGGPSSAAGPRTPGVPAVSVTPDAVWGNKTVFKALLNRFQIKKYSMKT